MLSKENKFLVQTVSCIAANKPDKLIALLKRAKSARISSRKLYEAILQTYLFCGFPAALESLKIFQNVFNFKPKEFIVSNIRANGEKVCKIIYGTNYSRLVKNVTALSPELSNWMILEGYGKVFSRPFLTLKQRELINAAILATTYYPVQLLSHLIGSINAGSNKDELKEVINSIKIYNTKANTSKALKLLSTMK